MATHTRRGICPWCDEPAEVVYTLIQIDEEGGAVEKFVERRCTNPDCPGDDVNQAAFRTD
jgi:hypothetical protein